jgi:hypothetical protein
LGLGVLFGRLAKQVWVGTGLELEAQLLYDLRAVRVGALLSTGGLGLGGSAVLGTRFRMSPGVRLDLAGDAGVAALGNEGSGVRPTVGARAAFTWVPAGGGRYWSFGVAVRHRFPETVSGQDACPFDPGSCPATVSLYRATLAGAFFTYGGAPPDR